MTLRSKVKAPLQRESWCEKVTVDKKKNLRQTQNVESRETEKYFFFIFQNYVNKMRLARGGGALLSLCTIYSALPLLPPLPIFPLLSLCSPSLLTLEGGYNLSKTNTDLTASFAFTSTKDLNSSFFSFNQVLQEGDGGGDRWGWRSGACSVCQASSASRLE